MIAREKRKCCENKFKQKLPVRIELYHKFIVLMTSIDAFK